MTTADGAIQGVEESTSAAEAKIRTWALVALFLYLVSGAAFVGFLSVGGIWATISDSVGLFLAISLMMLVIAFDELLRPITGSVSNVARWIGLVGTGLAAAGSIVLLTSEVSHEFIPGEGGLGMQFVGYGLHGVWFLLLAAMTRKEPMFSARWRLAAFLAGVGSVVAMLATIPLGADSMIVSSGFGLTFIAIIAWVIWTRSELNPGPS